MSLVHIFRRLRRWWVMHFRTTVRPGLYNRFGGRPVTTTEWEAQGGWNGALVPGWTVERPNWWEWGGTTAVTDATVEEARAKLDHCQDEWAARKRAT